MAKIGKIFIAVLVFAAVYFFSYWLLFVQIWPEYLSWEPVVAALATATAIAGLVWRAKGGSADGMFGTMMTWAVVAGAIGFCGGFFGPMIFAPDANQGPLLGLFITGPLGFVAGAIAGLIDGFRRRSQRDIP